MNNISIQINPNLRVDRGMTMADLDEDVHGGTPHLLEQVVVFEPVSGLVGSGWVAEIDEAERTVTLVVNWSSLTAPSNAVVAAHVREPNQRRAFGSTAVPAA